MRSLEFLGPLTIFVEVRVIGYSQEAFGNRHLTCPGKVTNQAQVSRPTGFIVFLSVAVLVLGAIHYYLWARLIRDPQIPSPWRVVATAGIVAAGASIPATLLLFRRSSGNLAHLLTWAAFIWLGLMFLLFVVLVGFDVVRLPLWVLRRATGGAPPQAERRRFLSRILAALALTAATGLGAAGLRAAVGRVAVRRVEIPLRRLRHGRDGFTLVQLTDLHIGPTIGREDLAQVVQTTNALAPDVIAITGDLVDGSVAQLRDAISPLRELRAGHGVFFVTGNHEYFSGAAEWVAELSRLGIRVLRNERVEIGSGDSAFDLAGVDDNSAARSGEPGHGQDLERALGGRTDDRLLVLLAHQPKTVLQSARFGVDLQLSVHTHGGQIWPFGLLVRLQQHFLAGLGRHQDTFIYVSRGTGYWGPPMRLGAPAEITQIVLRSAAT